MIVEADRMSEVLVDAAERGDTEEMRRLLSAGHDIDARDGCGRTAAMAATHGNQPAALELLIKAGADLDLQDDMKDNPLLYAGAEGLLEILSLAIEAGADTRITNRYGGSALIPAAHHGYVEAIRMLLARSDVDVNHVNNPGWTALMEAVILGDGGSRHQEIVRLLLDHGADAGIADKEGVTPLQHARNKRFKEIARMLESA
jgi:ankyrin repeat protein